MIGSLLVVDGDERYPWRWPRACAFALTSVSLTAAAHHMAHGDAPSLPVLAMTTVLIALGALPFVRREQQFGGIALAMLGLQGVLHVLFTRWPAAAHGTGHHHGVPRASVGFAHDATMLFAHVAAACVLAWWLRRGEARLWAVTRATGRVVLSLFRAAPLVAAPSLDLWTRHRQLAERRIGDLRLRALCCSVVRRGPPGLVAARA